MIKIENISLFGLVTHVNENYTLVNVTVDPEVVELPNYRRTPFASIIIKGEKTAESISNIDSENPNVAKREIFNIIKPIIESSYLKIYNSYDDSNYDTLKGYFADSPFHTIILYVDEECPMNDDDSFILIGGYPIRGFVSPISKSSDYNLLNGSFLSTKLFSMKSIVLEGEPWMKSIYTDNDFLYYDKIVYVLSEIKTKFEIRECLQISETHGIIYDYIYTPEIIGERLDIIERTMQRKVPVSGREYLFQKPDKNMFHLSDIPKDIIMKKHSIMRRM